MRHLCTLVACICLSAAAPAVAAAILPAYETEGWIFPGDPDCGASAVYRTKRIDTLKVQYLDVSDGLVNVITLADYGCNGYSVANARDIKANSKFQYVTVAANTVAAMRSIWTKPAVMNATIATIVNFVVKTVNFTGVDIDWEDFQSWTASDYTYFKTYMTRLGNALHKHNRKLMIDFQLLQDAGDVASVQFRFEHFQTMPVDYIVIMAYDYQYNDGSGTARSPNAWIVRGINYVKQRITNIDRIVVGLAADCYFAPYGTWDIQYTNNAASLPGYATRKRDPGSNELWWNVTTGGTKTFYSCIDSVGLDARRSLVLATGVRRISVWYIGGNPWFSS